MAGRPSNRDERFEQVMVALTRCVARYGLDGASLSAIAKEAGLSRPLIRHHLGNRDELIAALKDYLLRSFTEQNEAMIACLPTEARSEALVDLLFSDSAGSSPEMVLAFAALTARSAEDTGLRAACRESILEFEAAVASILRSDHPQADGKALNAAAHGIAALHLNVASLAPLDMPQEWTETAHEVARKMLNGLENNQ